MHERYISWRRANVEAGGVLINIMLRDSTIRFAVVSMHAKGKRSADLIPMRIHFPGNIEDMRNITANKI